MVYDTALKLHDQIASIAPIAGSRFLGYNREPESPISLLDTHGHADQYIPANVSNGEGGGPRGSTVSEDQFYYETVPNITRLFAQANSCNGPNQNYPTVFDTIREFSCNRPHGRCRAANASEVDVVQCVGDWGHTWPLHTTHPTAYAELAIDFFETHPKVRV